MDSKLRQIVLGPFEMLIEPHRRIYWVHLAFALVFAAAVWWRVRRRAGGSLWKYLFPRRVWLHRSSMFDLKWMFVRGALNPLLWWPLRLTAVQIALNEASWLRLHLGTPPWSSPLERGWIIAAFTVLLFLCDDFTRYLLHLLMHRIPALWELHKVHHSAEVLTPLTLYRVHPIESALNNLRGVFTLGALSGLFVWAFPGRIRGWEILGVDALGMVWSALGSNLRHSMVWLTWTRPLEHIFLSPAQHQVHHGRAERYWDKNFGSALAIWDWLGGSLMIASHTEQPRRFGLPTADRFAGRSLVGAVVLPMVAAVRVLVKPLGALRKKKTPPVPASPAQTPSQTPVDSRA